MRTTTSGRCIIPHRPPVVSLALVPKKILETSTQGPGGQHGERTSTARRATLSRVQLGVQDQEIGLNTNISSSESAIVCKARCHQMQVKVGSPPSHPGCRIPAQEPVTR